MEDIPREAGNRRWKNVVLNGDLEKLLLMCHHETLSAFCLVVQDRLSAAGNIVIEDQYARPDKKLGALQGGLFNCPPPKISKCRPVSKFFQKKLEYLDT